LQPMTKREIAQVIGLGLTVVLISSIPYVLGYLFEAQGLEFGGFLVDLDDSYSHLAKMQQGASGGWRYRILFTSEDHTGAYINTFYVGLGRASSLLGLTVMQTYQLARLFCGLSLLAMAYIFLSRFLASTSRRLVAYALICLSSGLGWLVFLSGSSLLGGVSPIDFWLMDAYTFFTVFTFPHLSAATALLLLFFALALRYFGTFELPALILGGLTLLGLSVIHPFAPLLVDSVLVAYWAILLLRRRRIPQREARAILIWALTPVPLIAYYYRAFASDPVFRTWSSQNILPSPPLAHLLLGYGIVFLLAMGGVAHVIRRKDERGLFLVAWVTSTGVLLYLPFTLQRRMIEGLHIPLCVLATVGLFEYLLPATMNAGWLHRFANWRGYGKDGLRRLVVFSVTVATFPSNLYLLSAATIPALQHDAALYYRHGEIEAVDWLGKNTDPTDTVLASYEIGRLIPARSGHRVFMGHCIETVEVERKRLLAESFFQDSTTDSARLDLLAQYGIKYVFHGPAERQLGAFDPSAVPYLRRVYNGSAVAVYCVVA